MRKHQLERDVASTRAERASVGDREQSRQPSAVVARGGERRASEGFGVADLQGAELPGCFNPVRGERIGRDDKGWFGAPGRCCDADPQANVAA